MKQLFQLSIMICVFFTAIFNPKVYAGPGEIINPDNSKPDSLSRVTDKESPLRKKDNSSNLSNGIALSGQWFLAYEAIELRGETNQEFKLKRGYVNLKKSFNKNLSVRVTQDVSVDRQGDGEGSIEIRLKYGYLRYEIQKLGILTKPFVEFGLVHRPWLDFEEHINRYRVQGKMFLERQEILRSADYGINFSSYLGGEMDADYKKTVNPDFAGKYGSFSVGIYNGGGYEALEKNNNKLFEGRFSFRPLPEQLPGFQMSWLTSFGKGNTPSSPDFSVNAGFLSWEHQKFVVTGTYYQGVGNLLGIALDKTGNSIQQSGFSFFGESKLAINVIRVFGRTTSSTMI